MNPMQALLGFTFWTLLLVAMVFLYRGLKFVQGTPINSWGRSTDKAGDAPFIRRAEDAHANCLENLPIFAVIVIAAIAMGRMEVIQPYAVYVFYARVGQSVVHLSGTGRPHVFVRATLWSIQLMLFFVMLLKLL